MATERKRPTSVLLHDRERLRDELYRACAEGHIKDVKKLKKKFIEACLSYDMRIQEEQNKPKSRRKK